MPGPAQYLVHESVLRPHGEFECAGDADSLSFCRQIADEMVTQFGITGEEAVARVNRHWSAAAAGQRPRLWIAGQDLVYHETPGYWAHVIYHRTPAQW